MVVRLVLLVYHGRGRANFGRGKVLEEVFENPWVRAAGLVLAVVLVCFLVYLLSPVLVPLFFAFLAAYVFDPVVDRFERRGVSRMVAIAGLALVGVALLLAVPLYLLPGIIHEADALRVVAQERLAGGGEDGGLLRGLLNRLPLRSLVESLGWAPADKPDYDPVAVLTYELASNVREGAADFLRKYGSDLVSAGQTAGTSVAGFFAGIGKWFLNVVLVVGNLALFAFVAGYLLKDFDRIIVSARELVPPKYRERTSSIFGKIDGQLRGFLRGQALVCLVLGVMYAVGLSIAGVPFGLALGIFGGVASFVPYLGLVLTIGPAMVLCLLQFGGFDWHFVFVLVTFGVAQFLEGTFITPKVVGEQVGLGPVWVILAVLVFGNALGFLGLLLAVPLAATLKVLVLEGLEWYRASDLFKDAAASE